MKPKSLMLLAVAAGFGLVAMIGAQQLMARNQGQTENVKVLVALSGIDPGVRLNPDLVTFKDFPKDNVPEGAVTKLEEYEERALKTRAYPGQPILIPQLGAKGQFGTSLQIPEGMRLATLKVDPTMIHSGIMKPGDRVDVVLTYQISRRGNVPDIKTRTILQFVQVFAMGNQMVGTEVAAEDTPKEVKSVSLLVSPVQAELLKYAEKKGTLHLTLRSTLDKAPVISEGADEEQLERLQNELARDMNPELAEEGSLPPQPSFADFVKRDPAPAAVVETNKPTWKVQVFQGPDQKTFEFEVEEPETKPAEGQPPGKPTADAWSPLQRWLFGLGKTTALVTP
jgi:pilus assembly protein CpaB